MNHRFYILLVVLAFSACMQNKTNQIKIDSGVAFLTALAPPQCDAKNHIVIEDQHEPKSQWDKRWWLNKVEKTLVPRALLTTAENEQLLKLGRVEILDQLMKKTRVS